MVNSSKTNLVARIHHNDLSWFMLQDWDGGGIYNGGDGAFTRIDHNIIHDAAGFIVGGVYIDWGKNYIIDHNIIYNVEWGIHLQHNIDGTPAGMSNMICYNNTVVVKRTSLTGYGPFNFGSSGPKNTQLGTFSRNNINVYRNVTISLSPSGYAIYTDAFDNATKSNNLNQPADPKFNDFLNGDLSLLPNSPAIDAGVTMEDLTLDGYTIPAYNDTAIGTVDIGAYEFGKAKWKVGYTDSKAPTAPSGLSASDITTSGFTLKWTPSTDNLGIASYEVHQGETLLGSTSGKNTSMNITGLNSGTKYEVILKARDAAGNISGASSQLSVTTLFPTGIENISDLEYGLKFFPNPAEKTCQIQLTNPGIQDGDVTLNVYSIQGKLIHSSIHITQPELLEISLNTSTLQSGVYLVDCTWKDGSRKTGKLVIK